MGFRLLFRLNLTLTTVNVYQKVTSHLDAGTIIWTILQTYLNLVTDICPMRKATYKDIYTSSETSRTEYNKIVASLAMEIAAM